MTMTQPCLTAIAAVAQNRVIGRDNDMPWHLPEDWARFKRVTMGGVMLMGRRCYQSVGRPLPGRVIVVLTRDPRFDDPRVQVVHTLEGAFEALAQHPGQRWWVAGGGEIYRLLLPYTTHLDLTKLHQPYPGDVLFPEIDPEQWRETSRTRRETFDFVEYVRTTGLQPWPGEV